MSNMTTDLDKTKEKAAVKLPLIIIAGPTAVGKSDIAIKLAKMIDGEVISADSVQVYRHMNIGSAKVTIDEMDGVTHHLIDVLEPTEHFDVTVFQKLCKDAVQDIISRGHLPILVGGTGFYIQAVLKDIDFEAEDSDQSIRDELTKFAEDNGITALHNILAEVDPESASLIPEGNVKRVIRAIEFYRLNGYKISEHNKREASKDSIYNSAYFVITDDRERLYNNINRRVDIMMEQGLLDEIRRLVLMGVKPEDTAMQALGYRQFLDCLDKEEKSNEVKAAIEDVKLETRHFAKRQLTWFRREKDCIWIDKSEFNTKEMILEYIKNVLIERGIL